MEAVILNSGLGKRMGNLTKKLPKCLLQISDTETILSRQLRILKENGITNIFMTTGYFEDKIKDYLDKNFNGLSIQYVYNPRYDSTGCIYSLSLVKNIAGQDLVLMHGDMVFEQKIFQKLLKSGKKNTVLVKETEKLPKKDFKARVKKNRITKIGVNLFDEGCYPLFPLYRLSNEFYRLWLIAIDKFILQGKVHLYAEDALNEILNQVELEPVYIDTELCGEVDNILDFEMIKQLLLGRYIGRVKNNES